MYVKIQTSDLANGNTGSCIQLAMYLEKENEKKLLKDKEMFFSQHRENVNVYEVIQHIDSLGKGGLGKNDAKFYSVVLAPSQEELAFISSDKEKLTEYTRLAMEQYAKNFNRGLEADDIVWYAKIERERSYKDLENLPEDKKSGDIKEGDNTHIHVIVSRRSVDKKMKLSPLANEKGGEGKIQDKIVTKGFDRDKFFHICEKKFDENFNYERNISESYQYKKTMVHGSKEAKEDLQQKMLKEIKSKKIESEQKIESQNANNNDYMKTEVEKKEQLEISNIDERKRKAIYIKNQLDNQKRIDI
ncbi:MAG: DUF5712 family protein [Raineya sp.]|jgi:hypothetical protein|nr:DUF5712 family protein [Raineya sp.]